MVHYKKLRAFTLLEVLVVLGIFIMIVSIAIPTALKQMQGEGVSKDMQNIASQVFLQQQSSYANLNDSAHGIAFSSNTITVFEGDTLATSTDSTTVEIQDNTTISQISLSNGATEFSFASGELKPSEYGYIQISNDSATHQLTINAEGLIETEKL